VVPAPTAAPRKAGKVNPHKLAKLEARMADLETRIAAIDGELAAPALYADGGARASELGRQQAQLRAELETVEADLLALYEADAA